MRYLPLSLLIVVPLLLFAVRARAKPPVKLDGFTGFSKDGSQFAWVSRSNIMPDVQNLYVINAGAEDAKSVSLEFARAKAEAVLKTGGFSDAKRPLPANVKVEADIYSTPPSVTINGKKISLGQYPFPQSDTWEVWGTDASGHHLALHIYGKPVDGVLTKAQGGTLHFYRVVSIPGI